MPRSMTRVFPCLHRAMSAAALSVMLTWPLTASADTVITTPAQPIITQPNVRQPTITQPHVTQPRIVQPRPVQPRPIQPQPVQPRPVQPHPIQPQPVQPRPIQPHPIQPRPVQPYSHRSGLGVDVIVAPQTEHWPSNYVPDDYQLRGYDGQPSGEPVCRHRDGSVTYSTSGVDCPDASDKGVKRWSTQ